MKLCRFLNPQSSICIGLLGEDQRVLDLSAEGIERMFPLLESEDLLQRMAALDGKGLPSFALAEVRLLAPIEQQEVWAAGVTYFRSKKARMEESDFSANAYDRVYEAARPELFFKSSAEAVVGTGDSVGMRKDSRWNVPEPELALVINSQARIVGYTIGNDMSSRELEGENLLYLAQAKTYDRSCALGPCLRMAVDEAEARAWRIELQIRRADREVFSGETSVSQLKRSFEELVGYLYRCRHFDHGAILLTGTGIVPPHDFSLQAGDVVRIRIGDIGELENRVQEV